MSRFLISFLVANLIGGFFLWLTARELPVGELRAWAAGSDPWHLARWSLAFVGVYIVCHGARIVRWYELVRPLGPVEPRVVSRVCAVGFAAIMLLPLRLGELVRPYLLSRRTDFKVSAVLGTAVVERVIDGLIMTGLLFVTLATYSGDRATGFAYTTGAVSAAIFLGALTVCLLALWRKEWTSQMVRRVAGVVSTRVGEALAETLEAFIEGFRALLEAHSLGRFMALTVLYWGTNVLSMWLLARFGFGLDVGLWDTATVLALLVIGIMIPAGPAMAGNFEFFMTRALGLFVSLEVLGAEATAFAAAVHILQFVVIIVPGFAVMWLEPESRHLIRLADESQRASHL